MDMTHTKSIIKQKLLQITIILASFNISAEFFNNNIIVAFLISIATNHFYQKMLSLNIRSKCQLFILLYTLLFSIAIVVGQQVHYIEMRSGPTENYIDLNFLCLCNGVLLAFLLYPILTMIINFINVHSIKECSDKHIFYFWGVLLFIFCSWIPYLLSFYPAGIVGDGAETLEYSIQSENPLSNHWVVLYILVLRFFLWIGTKLSNDINVGIFLYALVESIIYAAVTAAVIAKLKAKGIASRWLFIFTCIYAFSGFFASYSMSLWKDGIFSSAIVLIVLMFWDYPCESKPSFLYCLKLASLLLFICFWRNNGIYILLLCVIGFALLIKKNKARVIATALGIFFITLIVQGPIYDKIGVQKDSLIESISIPLQQIAAVLSEEKKLTPLQEKVLFSIMPKQKWLNSYCPTLSDDLKKNVDINYLEENLGSFFKVWIQLLPSNLFTYIKAYLMQTLGFWQPFVHRGNYYDYWIGIQDIHNRGYVERDLINEVANVSVRPFLLDRMYFISSGSMVWLLFFSITAICCQKENRRKRLLCMIPLISSWGVVMLASPIAYAYRYIVMLPMSLPIIVSLPFLEGGGFNIQSQIRTHKNILLLLVFGITVYVACANTFNKLHITQTYKGGEFLIDFTDDNYNADDYVTGISANEGAFTWSDGKFIHVTVPVNKKYAELSITIDVLNTFNGVKTYIIKQGQNILTNGTLNGPGLISFNAKVNSGKLDFIIYLPDAQIVKDVDSTSSDSREISLQLNKITLKEIGGELWKK